MTKRTTKTVAVAALAALGLSNLSPVQVAVTGAVLGISMVATPALAQQNTTPGVGIVIKKKPCCASIIAPSDNNGVLRLTGLEPGEYEVSLIGQEQVTSVTVGRDGELFTRAVAEDNGSNRRVENLNGVRPTPEIAAIRGSSVIVALRGSQMRWVDVNTSTAADFRRLVPTTSPEAAALIVAERTRGGAFRDMVDFAQRVCPSVSVDFDLIPTRMGSTQIIAKSGDPKANGFKCAPAPRGAGPTFELYGARHSYVGHVTLLR